MFLALRTLVFVGLFMGFVLVYAPLRLVLPAGTSVRLPYGLVGLAPLVVGLAVVLWCVWEFATRGQGTPAIFDPPRKLVTRGLYRFVRNPMYVGADLLLLGMSILYLSADLLVYAAGFAIVTHLFVLSYEEWALARKFGESYLAYKREVPRWMPRLSSRM
jgi:protein-S-isoprenylcysteine O-methyltransferase Ste14